MRCSASRSDWRSHPHARPLSRRRHVVAPPAEHSGTRTASDQLLGHDGRAPLHGDDGTLREVGEVPIAPNFTTSFIFDTPVVQREGFILEERERFRQATLSEDGLLLTVLPSGDLPPGKRLKLTIRFADGALPTSVDLALVVSARAESQVEVYRRPRPGDSLQREAEQAKAGFQQCLTELERERVERGVPRGLTGMLALNQLNVNGIRATDILKDSTPAPEKPSRWLAS